MNLKRNKTVFKEYIRDPQCVWIHNDSNFKKEVKKFPILGEIGKVLEKIDSFRFKKLIDRNLQLFDYPEQIVDGLELNYYSELHFKSKYNDLDSFNFEFDYSDFANQWNIHCKKTEELMTKKDNWILFEGCFEYKGYKMRPDVLIKKNGKYTIFEVKACSFPKEEHAIDLTYQISILKKLGYFDNSWKYSIATLNKEYIHSTSFSDQQVSNKIIKSDWETFHSSSPYLCPGQEGNGLQFCLNKKITSAIEKEKTFVSFIETFLVEKDFDLILEEIDKIQLQDDMIIDPISKINVQWKKYGGSTYLPYFLMKAGLEVIGWGDDENIELENDDNEDFDIEEPKFNYSTKPTSVFSLAGDSGFDFKKKANLFNDGFDDIFDIDSSVLLPTKVIKEDGPEIKLENCVRKHNSSCKRLLQKEYLNNKTSFIMKEEIIADLKNYNRFPIYMFDFETFKNSIPRIDGTTPYNQIPFQYSIHVIFENGDVKHLEWLSKNKTNLYKDFWENFSKDIIKYGEGTWVSFNKAFEKMVIKNFIANRSFDAMRSEKELMKKIYDRVIDLMLPFFKRYYYNSSFKGSYSIKVIAPYFSKELDYSKLEKINKGDQASKYAKFWIMSESKIINEITKSLPKIDLESEWKHVRKNMLKYCEYDTLSMVKIYFGLIEELKSYSGR